MLDEISKHKKIATNEKMKILINDLQVVKNGNLIRD